MTGFYFIPEKGIFAYSTQERGNPFENYKCKSDSVGDPSTALNRAELARHRDELRDRATRFRRARAQKRRLD